MTAETKDSLHCTFCGKSQRHVELLVNGPNVRICNECVDICNEIIADKRRERVAEEWAGAGERPQTRGVMYAGTLTCPMCRAQFALHTEAVEGRS